MKKILLLITLFFISTNNYAINKTLSCHGSVKVTGTHVLDNLSRDLILDFDEDKKTFSIDSSLLCNDNLLEVTDYKINKDIVLYSHKTKNGDLVKSEEYCESIITLNRYTGNLSSYKINKFGIGSLATNLIYNGTFKCELGKQKF
jgi:hypothetical protein